MTLEVSEIWKVIQLIKAFPVRIQVQLQNNDEFLLELNEEENVCHDGIQISQCGEENCSM